MQMSIIYSKQRFATVRAAFKQSIIDFCSSQFVSVGNKPTVVGSACNTYPCIMKVVWLCWFCSFKKALRYSQLITSNPLSNDSLSNKICINCSAVHLFICPFRRNFKIFRKNKIRIFAHWHNKYIVCTQSHTAFFTLLHTKVTKVRAFHSIALHAADAIKIGMHFQLQQCACASFNWIRFQLIVMY